MHIVYRYIYIHRKLMRILFSLHSLFINEKASTAERERESQRKCVCVCGENTSWPIMLIPYEFTGFAPIVAQGKTTHSHTHVHKTCQREKYSILCLSTQLADSMHRLFFFSLSHTPLFACAIVIVFALS